MLVGCRTVIATLAEEGGRSALARAGVRLHLAVCGDCHRYVEQAAAVRAALGAVAAGAGAVPAATRARLMERFRAWRAAQPAGAPPTEG